MVLSAGLGTRLRPLTLEVPKPLVWLGDRPQLDHVLASFAAQGVDRVVLNTHHLAGAFDQAWVGRQPLALEIVHEAEILGTGGGIANARRHFEGRDVLVWNGDIVGQLDLQVVARAHAKLSGEALLLTGPRLRPKQGTLGLSEEGAVVRMRDLVVGEERFSADYAGIALVRDDLVRRLPSPGCLVGDGFMPAMRRGVRLETLPAQVPFVDIGSRQELLAANLAWLLERGIPRWIAPEVEVPQGLRLGRVVIAPGATIEGQGELDRVVVWPGATVRAPLEGAIVTPRAVVAVEAPR